uniref:Pre-mRNA polyadenylation factor Fip1 domain-containing protein n=1 Tax=Psilocybe cubensis TaxID=181762 RepID=A0A8H7YAJ0_PSICU
MNWTSHVIVTPPSAHILINLTPKRPDREMDEDDEFLYGEKSQTYSEPAPEPKSNDDLFSVSTERGPAPNGFPDFLENDDPEPEVNRTLPTGERQAEEEDEDEDEGDQGDDSDDDIEIILEPVARSLDFRNQNKSSTTRTTSSTPAPTKAPQPSLTTEYTPIQRGGPQPSATPSQNQADTSFSGTTLATPTPVQAQPSPATQPPQPSEPQNAAVDDGVDTSTLPVAQAPPSHPPIDPDVTAVFDGRSILELDLGALADKPWRRPGSDISDWFNYGFDELSWEAYCYRRRDLGDLANVLKTNVIGFSAMPEDQLIALPPDIRTMVMTGANAMMNNAGANANMMPMMDMSMMGPMGMGMNGEMGMGNPMMQGMMSDGGQAQQGVGVGVLPTNAPSEQVNGVNMMQDGFNPNAPGMMNMGMGGEFMQEQNQMPQQIYPVMEQSNVAPVSSGRGTPIPFRARGAPGLGGRARGFPGRGRGRGGLYGGDAPVPVPVRPASPLPPGVPTGPRNQNKYKDRDGNAPAVDGLDYGGGKEGGMSRRTPSGEPEERISSRKRRSSPGLDDIRSSKRR